MKKLLPPDEVAAAFHDHLSPYLNPAGPLMPGQALAAILTFYQTASIAGIDTRASDYDTLLFDYGTFDWYDGAGPRFSLGVKRQFLLAEEEAEEPFQLRLTLYYRPEAGAAVASFNAWSVNYPSPAAWAAAVRQTHANLAADPAQAARAARLKPLLDAQVAARMEAGTGGKSGKVMMLRAAFESVDVVGYVGRSLCPAPPVRRAEQRRRPTSVP